MEQVKDKNIMLWDGNCSILTNIIEQGTCTKGAEDPFLLEELIWWVCGMVEHTISTHKIQLYYSDIVKLIIYIYLYLYNIYLMTKNTQNNKALENPGRNWLSGIL